MAIPAKRARTKIHALNEPYPAKPDGAASIERRYFMCNSPSNDVAAEAAAAEPARMLPEALSDPANGALQDPKRRAAGPARIPSRSGSGAWSARKRRIWRADTRQVRASSARPAAS